MSSIGPAIKANVSISVSKDVMMKLTLLDMFYMLFLSWSDRRSAHRDLQSDCSASGLHDRWLHDVAQPFHHWNDLPFSSGQSVCRYIHPAVSICPYIHPSNKHA